MKKTIFAILLCGVMFFGLTGCCLNKNEFNIGEKSSVEPTTSDVTLTLKEGTLTIVIIAILTVLMQEGYLADICIIYAMISFLAVVVLTLIYMGIYNQKKQEEK